MILVEACSRPVKRQSFALFLAAVLVGLNSDHSEIVFENVVENENISVCDFLCVCVYICLCVCYGSDIKGDSEEGDM